MQPQPAALHATRAVGKRPSLPGGCGNSKEGRALPGSGKHRPCLEILTSSPPQQWAFPSTFSRRRVAAPRKAHWVVRKGCYRSKDKSLASRARASHLSPLPVALAATVPFNPTAPSVPAVLGAAERHPASGTAPCHSHGVTKERMLSVSSPVALGFASPPPTAGSPAPSWPKPGLKLAHTHLFRGEDSKRQRLSLSSGLSPSSTDGPFLPSPHHSGVPRTQEPCTEREGSAPHRTGSPHAPRAWGPSHLGSPQDRNTLFLIVFHCRQHLGLPLLSLVFPSLRGCHFCLCLLLALLAQGVPQLASFLLRAHTGLRLQGHGSAAAGSVSLPGGGLRGF